MMLVNCVLIYGSRYDFVISKSYTEDEEKLVCFYDKYVLNTLRISLLLMDFFGRNVFG